jgi:hypothetical protein
LLGSIAMRALKDSRSNKCTCRKCLIHS